MLATKLFVTLLAMAVSVLALPAAEADAMSPSGNSYVPFLLNTR